MNKNTRSIKFFGSHAQIENQCAPIGSKNHTIESGPLISFRSALDRSRRRVIHLDVAEVVKTFGSVFPAPPKLLSSFATISGQFPTPIDA